MGGLSSSLGSKIVDVVIIINSYFCRFNGPIVMNVPYSFICVADSLEFIANSVEKLADNNCLVLQDSQC